VAWRVSGTRIERSADGGATWRREDAPDIAPPVVGSAPSPEVCWIAGADGTILRRGTDGRWARVTRPAAASIVRIEARSALAASLVTADGRRYATTDGGDSWAEVR
jgi:photosystem II stability/assembly factor-like uncharacterized protein